MANADQVKALIKCHAEGDDSRFYSVAIQMAAQAAKLGHSRLAEELRTLIDQAKEKGFKRLESNTVHINQPRGELPGLLSVTYPKERLSSVILPENTENRLRRLILEQRQKVKLLENGLTPRRKVLFFGPPGTGKTLTATALAGELHLPLYTILLDGLITKYMGETAAKLRLIFENIDRVRGIYFFDEFDAIGSHRTNSNDVGEIRRVLNSFLQFLEQSNSQSIIIAATNNIDLLDKALFRRFDDIIEYDIPDELLAIETLKNCFSSFDTKCLDYTLLSEKCKNLSFAEICKVCEDTLKQIILDDNNKKLCNDIVINNINERFNTNH